MGMVKRGAFTFPAWMLILLEIENSTIPKTAQKAKVSGAAVHLVIKQFKTEGLVVGCHMKGKGRKRQICKLTTKGKVVRDACEIIRQVMLYRNDLDFSGLGSKPGINTCPGN